MANSEDKAAKSASPEGKKTPGTKTAGAAAQQSPKGGGAQWTDILQAAQAAEEAVAAALQGMTLPDGQQIHPTERAVYLAVHGAPQPEAKK